MDIDAAEKISDEDLAGLDPQQKPLIYIAGPYTLPDPVINLHRAVEIGEEVEALGAAVLIPHMSLMWHIISPAKEALWYERDLHQLERCDAVLRFTGYSRGSDHEVEFAERKGIPVFYDDRIEDDADTLTAYHSGWEALSKWIDTWPAKVWPL